MDKVCLGKAVKLHGIKGEIKIATKFDDDFDIKKITVVFDEKQDEFQVERIFKVTDGVVISLKNIDLESAKNLIGSWFYIERNLVAGKMLIEDIKNSSVYFETGEKLGEVQDVQGFGSAEVIFLMTEKGRELMFPNANGVILSFDYTEKKLVVNKEILYQISDYGEIENLDKNDFKN